MTIAEYEKRLSRYCKLQVIEVVDEKTPDGASTVVEDQIREKEAERILNRQLNVSEKNVILDGVMCLNCLRKLS